MAGTPAMLSGGVVMNMGMMLAAEELSAASVKKLMWGGFKYNKLKPKPTPIEL